MFSGQQQQLKIAIVSCKSRLYSKFWCVKSIVYSRVTGGITQIYGPLLLLLLLLLLAFLTPLLANPPTNSFCSRILKLPCSRTHLYFIMRIQEGRVLSSNAEPSYGPSLTSILVTILVNVNIIGLQLHCSQKFCSQSL